MRRILSVLILSAAVVTPALAQDGLVIEVKPKSWLNAGTETRTGYGRDYALSPSFGGGPVNGISSRGSENLPMRGQGTPLIQFNFLGANAAGPAR